MTSLRLPSRRAVRLLLTVSSACVLASFFVERANASENTSTELARVAKVSSTSITLQPFTYDQQLIKFWDVKIPMEKGATATLPDGSQIETAKLKSGAVVSVTLAGKVETKTAVTGCARRKGGRCVSPVYGEVSEVKGYASNIKVLDGRCETKKVNLGGRGEKTAVAICRYWENGQDNYRVVVNAEPADHTPEVISALVNKGEVRITVPGAAPLVAWFGGQDPIATATTSAAGVPVGTKVRVEIYADGPHDGKGPRVFKVTSSAKL